MSPVQEQLPAKCKLVSGFDVHKHRFALHRHLQLQLCNREVK